MGIKWLNVVLIFSVILFVALLVWGVLGGVEAQGIGVTCDVGLTDYLCWKWHKNPIGEIQEVLSDTGDAIGNLIGKR